MYKHNISESVVISNMHMKDWYLIMLLSFGLCCNTDARDAVIRRLISDVVESHVLRGSTTRVNAYVCWGPAEDAKLWHSLSMNGIFASVIADWPQWNDILVTRLDESILFLLDANCNNASRLLSLASKQKLFAFPHRWLILDDKTLNMVPQSSTDSVWEPDNVNSQDKEVLPTEPCVQHTDEEPLFDTSSTLRYENDSSTTFRNLLGSAIDQDKNAQTTTMTFTEDISTGTHSQETTTHSRDNKILLIHSDYVKENLEMFAESKYANDEKENVRNVDIEIVKLMRSFNTELYEGLEMNVDSQIVIVWKEIPFERFLLVEIFRNGKNALLTTNVLGEWDTSIGLLLKTVTPTSVAVRRHNLRKTTLTASMVVTNNDTLVHLTDLKQRHIDTITKYNYVLFRHALEMMNASVELIIVDSWGYANNGSWSGMVGCLQRGEADVGATALFFTKDRVDVIEYIAMTTPTRAMFVFRQPPLSYVSNVFTLPFSTSVWISSAVLIALTGLLLYAALRVEKRRAIKPLDRDLQEYLDMPLVEKTTWSDVMLLSLGAVCQQGSTVEPRGVPGRLITLILFIAVMFLYTSYSASIVSLLQSSTASINTLEDLLNSRLQVGVHDIVYNHHYFKASTEPVRKAIYNRKVAPSGKTPRFFSLEEGVRRIRKGLFAFHMEQSPGYQLISETFREDEKCGFKEISFLQVIDPYLAIQRGSPYREMLKLGYRKIHERGLQSRTLLQYYTKKPECTSHGSNFVSVGLVDIYPALLILVYGIMCAVSVLVLEILVNKRLCRHRK